MKILIFAGKVANAFNFSNLEAEVGGYVFEASLVCSSEFQNSQGYLTTNKIKIKLKSFQKTKAIFIVFT